VKSSAHDVVSGHQATIPVTGFAATSDGRGYWMTATDGSIYTFGDATQYGSLPALGLTPPPVTVNGFTPPSTVGLSIPLVSISSLVRTPDGGGATGSRRSTGGSSASATPSSTVRFPAYRPLSTVWPGSLAHDRWQVRAALHRYGGGRRACSEEHGRLFSIRGVNTSVSVDRGMSAMHVA
jgi:hypothetical protein